MHTRSDGLGRRKRCPARRLGVVAAFIAGLLAGLGAIAPPSQAGELAFYEASVGIGQVRTIAGPVTNALIDIDYSPASAEGGKLFGMSEIEIEATGNLVLGPTGFACQAVSCLYAPQPFTAGQRLRVTAGNDLAGETAATANLLTIGVTGSSGHIVVTPGEYIDGTGATGGLGAVQLPDVTILVTVPEPGPGPGLAAAGALLALLRRASASARSGRGPVARAPRAP